MYSELVEKEMFTFFPNGIRVLLVDDDSMFLKTSTVMLSQMHYKVATCGSPNLAMRFLSGDRVKDLDVLLVDAHQVAKCGFDLRTIVENDLHVPVIYFMSTVVSSAIEADAQSNSCLARVIQSATYIIKKPLDSGEVSRLWRTVASRRCVLEEAKRSKNCMSLLDKINNVPTEGVHYTPARASSGGRQRKNNCSDSGGETDSGAGSSESHRVMWTPALKNKFEHALKIIGTGAHPNEILDHMNVRGLSRQHVASYLQKYRAKLEKKKKNDRCGGTPPSPCSYGTASKEYPVFRSFLPTANSQLFLTSGTQPSNAIDLDAAEEFTGENDATAALPSPVAPLLSQQSSENSATADTRAPAMPSMTDQQRSSSSLMETSNVAAMAFSGGNDAPAADQPLWSPTFLYHVDDDISSNSLVPMVMQAAEQPPPPPSTAAAFTGNAAPALLPWDDAMLQQQHEPVMVDAAAEEKEAAEMVDEMLDASNNTDSIAVPPKDDGYLEANDTVANGSMTLAEMEAFLMLDIPTIDDDASVDGSKATGNGDEGGSGTRDWDPFP